MVAPIVHFAFMVVLALASSACGPSGDVSTTGPTSTSGSAGSASTESTGSSSRGDVTADSNAQSTTEAPGEATHSDDATTMNPPPPDAGGGTYECDPIVSDCDEGFQCVPFDPMAAGLWTGSHCVAVPKVLKAAGDSCEVTDPIAEPGTCGPGLVCAVDSLDAEQGSCVPFCWRTVPCPSEQDCLLCDIFPLGVCVDSATCVDEECSVAGCVVGP